MANTRSETVAEKIAYQPGLPVDDLEGAFGAIWNAESAAGASALVYGNDFSNHVASMRAKISAICIICRYRVRFPWILILDLGQLSWGIFITDLKLGVFL
jgi:hypothetical protein